MFRKRNTGIGLNGDFNIWWEDSRIITHWHGSYYHGSFYVYYQKLQNDNDSLAPHRENGPAVIGWKKLKPHQLTIFKNASEFIDPETILGQWYEREWFIDGGRHRLSGPAREFTDSREWWVKGACLELNKLHPKDVNIEHILKGIKNAPFFAEYYFMIAEKLKLIPEERLKAIMSAFAIC